MKLGNNKGIGLSDTIIAMAIFIFFSGVMITISYNIYLQSNFIKRNDTATNIIVDILEYAKTNDMEDVDYEMLADYVADNYEDTVTVKEENSVPSDSDIGKGYTMYISVTDANSIDQEEYPQTNIVKAVSISIYYKFAGKIRNIEMNTLIKK